MVDQVLMAMTGLSAEVLAGQWWAMTGVRRREAPSVRRPAAGERAAGYGVSGRIAVVQAKQPLAADGIWRIVLAGQSVGCLVRRDEQDDNAGQARWQLLQIDDMTEAQLDAFDAAMLQDD